MAKQLIATPSTKKISDLYSRITGANPTLILQPPFQRKFVWNSEHKERFIETILMGLPIPEIYIAQTGIDVEKIEAQEVVVDGQQRLSTIVQYIDEPEDSTVFGNIVPKYKDLGDQKREFINYNIVIRDLGDVDSETIREIFKRINLTQYSLNQVELHNAIYDGQFISTAKAVLEHIEHSDLPFLTESKITRMEDLYYLILIMVTIENGGYFNRDKEIERYIVQYNDNYERAEEVKSNMVATFELIKNLNIPLDSMWYRSSNFFILFVEIYKMMHIKKLDVNLEKMRESLDWFESQVFQNKGLGKQENDFSRYYSYMYADTNSRASRVVRGELFQKHIILH
ncbi:DUF262 domain-containing protein [Sporomusa sp.]|uniref:DUF262 domain-containing protein n=1 Tax=Sporomusa sp. TaxID=2078658 RepID=UPI002C008C16|nr:DUF262 domain-containing protein [Sporomusa sp.]HWR42275.1 DUF262 domain-containing protein [Sporomusa sp.]